jgi:hypothetical protein
MWVCDTYNLYRDRLEEFELCDTRTIQHQMRLMITHNQINPKVYEVSKVDDTTPAGVVQITLKQTLYDPKRDNPDLMVCDYYDDGGDIAITKPSTSESSTPSTIMHMAVNSDGELEPAESPAALSIGTLYYFGANFDGAQWRIELEGDYDDDTRRALEKLMVIRKVDDSTISIRPGKSNKIKGLTFKLTVCDVDGDHESSINLEVES